MAFILDGAKNFVLGAQDVAIELFSNLYKFRAELVPYLIFWFTLHFIVQYALPSIYPAIYDVLGTSEKMKGKTIDRVELAKEARTHVVAFLHATITVIVCIYGFNDPETRNLAGFQQMYASTELSKQFVLFAVSFFMWDTTICFLFDNYDIDFKFHAVGCFVVFGLALKPFLHHMMFQILFFELSTPFLHIRKTLIQIGQTNHWYFQLSQYLFALAFFYSRIYFGYIEVYKWYLETVKLEEAGMVHSYASLTMYRCLAVAFCLLNAHWFYGIATAAFGKKRTKVLKHVE
jgi:TLC domain